MNIGWIILLGFIGIIGIFSLIRLFIGLITEATKFILYQTIRGVIWIFKMLGRLLAFMFKKIRNKIRDRFHPDEGAYYIRFTPKDRRGNSRIKYSSIR